MTSDGPLVVGLDSSTQGTKAIAWDPAGRAVSEGRAPIALLNPAHERYEQDPADWWTSAVAALEGCTGGIDVGRLEGLAISNQRETLAFLDADGRPTRPAITWLDGRSREQVRTFAEAFGAERIHEITGRPPDLTSCLYRFAWMREHEPEVYARTARFVDVQTYLVRALCGAEGFRTGWISADPIGLYDLVEKRWSEPLLEALGLDASRLPEAVAPGTELGRVGRKAAAATGLPADLPVYAAGGDGQCAALGVGCTRSERAYINLGTAIVSGIWAPEFLADRAWRTELAAQGHGYVYESCLRSGAFLVNWFVDNFVARGKADAATFEALERAAADMPIGSEGLLVQPYFEGVMDPHWDASARGVVLGLSGSHRPEHVYRAIIESMTLDRATRTRDMERAAGVSIDHMVAIGGGANSPLWRQMLADASGKPVHVSDTVEASALGAGMIAACGAGWYPDIDAAARAMAGATTAFEPDPARGERYAELAAIYDDLYAATADVTHRLVAFADERRREREGGP